jgi:hypothetical protein
MGTNNPHCYFEVDMCKTRRRKSLSVAHETGCMETWNAFIDTDSGEKDWDWLEDQIRCFYTDRWEITSNAERKMKVFAERSMRTATKKSLKEMLKIGFNEDELHSLDGKLLRIDEIKKGLWG